MDGFHIPLIYTLTTNKRQDTYETILKVLLDIEPKLNPTDFTVDFEAGAMNAVNKSFPMAQVHGCYFHFTSNVWKHVQSNGLQTVYNNDGDFALQIRMLIALAFVPIEHVRAAYNALMETPFYSEDGMDEYAEHKEKIDALVKYFQDTYVYTMNRHGKESKPLFKPEIWNVYENVLLGKFSFQLKKETIYPL